MPDIIIVIATMLICQKILFLLALLLIYQKMIKLEKTVLTLLITNLEKKGKFDQNDVIGQIYIYKAAENNAIIKLQ